MFAQCSNKGGCAISKGIDTRLQDTRIWLSAWDASLVEQGIRGAEGQYGLAMTILSDHEFLCLSVSGQPGYPLATIWQNERIEQDWRRIFQCSHCDQ